MKNPKPMAKPKSLWLVVNVWHGLIQPPEVFKTKRTAKQRENILRKEMQPEYDEVGLFEVKISCSL
jgi:hypothetical protein